MKLLALIAVGALQMIAGLGVARGVEPHSSPNPTQSAAAVSEAEAANAALAQSLAGLIRRAIPAVIDRQQDWGATKEVAVGISVHGKPFHRRFHRRTKAVNHGVWKHYTVRLVEPEKHLVVRVDELRALPGARFAFTVHLESPLDAWARAKAYQYGVHLGAVEIECDARLRVRVQGEVGLRLTADGFTIEPVVTGADVHLDELRMRRVSNADGPLVRQLSDGVRRLAEEELDGPRLAEKLNRSIDKRRDRLSFSPSELLSSGWRQLMPDNSPPDASR